MKQNEIDIYNIYLFLYSKGENKMEYINKLYQSIIDYKIATENELELITTINGYNETTLNDVVYVRTGYHSIDDYIREC